MNLPQIQEGTWNSLLFVGRPEIPVSIQEQARKLGLKEKNEYHISIFVSANAKIVRDAAMKKFGSGAYDKLSRLTESFSWDYNFKNEYYLHEHQYSSDELVRNGYKDLTEHTRRTIVQCVDISDLPQIYQKAEELFDIKLPRPVPHVTLFYWSSYNDYPGIGINSKEEFDKFTVRRLEV